MTHHQLDLATQAQERSITRGLSSPILSSPIQRVAPRSTHRGVSHRWMYMFVASLSVCLMLSLTPHVVSAEPSSDASDLLTTPRGLYLGVKPGEVQYAPGKQLTSDGGVQRVTWVGFQARRDRAQIFIQTDSRPIFEIAESNALKVVIDFPNARLHTPNEARTLDTSFFPTVVRSVKARQVSRNLVRLVVRLREPARYRKQTDAKFLHLIFDPPREPIDVIAEHERELDERMKNTAAVEYKGSK